MLDHSLGRRNGCHDVPEMTNSLRIDKTISIATLVKWVVTIGTVLVLATLWYAGNEANLLDLDKRISELEGSMDVKNGMVYVGKDASYYRGVKDALEAEGIATEDEP